MAQKKVEKYDRRGKPRFFHLSHYHLILVKSIGSWQILLLRIKLNFERKNGIKDVTSSIAAK